MAVRYEIAQVRRLQTIAEAAALHWRHAPARYEEGDVFDLAITGVCPAVQGRARLVVEKFIGGGFAGQVYRARMVELDLPGGGIPGLAVGGVYAVKVMIPPSRGARLFRDALHWLGYQGPFGSQVLESAARTGALWQKLIRRGARSVFGSEQSVRDIYATFFEPGLGSFGELGEWIEGRTWKFEIDDEVFDRRRQAAATAKHSHEYLAKKDFMARLVRLFHAMGAPELARQYEWWSGKSQANVLKRSDAGDGPADGLTALDFRAGLVLLAFLPMSPVDFALILRGLRRGTLVQFDRGDLHRLESFCRARAAEFADLAPALEELKRIDPEYRASLAGNHDCFRLIIDGAARRKVREGSIQGWTVRRLADAQHAETLRRSAFAFALFLLAGFIPIIGNRLRRLWGNSAYRQHVIAFFTSIAYAGRTIRAAQAECLIDWYRSGRIGARGIDYYLRYPTEFWCTRFTFGLIPFPKFVRFLTDWRYAWDSMREAVIYPIRFYRDAQFRIDWLKDEIEDGARQGMLTPAEKEQVLERILDPFIQKYLKCIAVHVCTLPITQVISVAVAIYASIRFGKTWKEGMALATTILLAFQALPVSPGSLTRGTYVVYLMIKERNWRNYWVAVIVSYWHYIGYLGFPIQMVKEFPTLSRFMAGRWATKMVGIVPVFGEKGGLLEHWVFDAFFNVPLTLRRWITGRPQT